MNERCLKAYIYNKYRIKVKSIGFGSKYYTLSEKETTIGSYFDYTKKWDSFGDKLSNRLFDSVSDILDAIKESSDYKRLMHI